jgi:hypothetical protein
MGVVKKARHLKTGEMFAVKIVKSKDPEKIIAVIFFARFAR